jgi:hypothetical protein
MCALYHKVHIYLEYHSVCPFVRIGIPPPPLPLASVLPPAEPGGGGTHSTACEGVGESQFRRLEKKLGLCLLRGLHRPISMLLSTVSSVV